MKENKEKVISLRVNENDFKLIKEYALNNGNLSVGSLMRFIVVNYIKKNKNALELNFEGENETNE